MTTPSFDSVEAQASYGIGLQVGQQLRAMLVTSWYHRAKLFLLPRKTLSISKHVVQNWKLN